MIRRGNRYLAFKHVSQRVLLAVFLLPSATLLHSQNLVPNPGFEETDSCTFGLGLGELHDWYSAFGTPDHLQSCQPYGVANGLPMNQFTYQQPFEGSSCTGIFTYDGDSGQEWREWIMVPMMNTMIPSQTYYCSFRANAAFGGNVANPNIWLSSDHLGMLFTTYDRQWLWGDPYPAVLNQAHILYPQILSDTVGWSFVSGSFVADSAYTYLMIGNFFNNALTDTLHFAPPGPNWDAYSYTLIDAVCVSPDPNGCELGQSVEGTEGTRPFVCPNPARDGLVIGNSAGSDALVLDMLGRPVWRGMIASDRYTLDVVFWARGAYVLHVERGEERQIVKFVLTE